MTRYWIALLTLLLVLAFAFGPSLTQAQDKAPLRTKWEYKIVRVSANLGAVTSLGGTRSAVIPGTISDKELTDLGEQGWELIKITDGQPIPKHESFTPTVYYFKRPR